MKNIIQFIGLFLIMVSIIFIFVKLNERREMEIAEYAYMEGQADYMIGDIRIKQQGNDYTWVKSPWDSDKKPIHEYRSQY